MFSNKTNDVKKPNIDDKDRLIISILGNNSRETITKIAKKVKLSRDSVKKRIEKYRDDGLISGFRTIVDIKKFRYLNYHLFINLNKPNEEIEEKKINQIKSKPFIRSILRFSGKYDLEIAMIAKDTDEFEKELYEISKEFGDLINDLEILIINSSLRTGPLPNSFINTPQKIIEKTPLKTQKEYNIDSTDKNILKIISNDARIKLFKLANELDISADAVNYRIKKMVSSGYIIKFVPAINYDLLGYQIYAVLMKTFSLSEKEKSKLKQFFETDNNILWGVKCSGKYNILFYICTRSPQHVHQTLNNIRNLFPIKIKDNEIMIASRQYKYSYLPDKLII